MFNHKFTIPLLLLLTMLMGGKAFSQVTITQWNFDQQNLNPITGSGTAVTVGGVTSSFATGNPNLYAWSTTSYPAQSTASGTAGVQFNVSTLGYNSIVVSWENRNSNTSANRLRLQYTINGNDWLNFEATDDNATNTNDGNPIGFESGRFISTATDWFFRSADLSLIPGVEQNPLFAIRLVTEFEDATMYGATNGGNYTSDGAIRFENVTFTGIPGSPDPVIASVMLPQFMSGNTPANNRLPFAYRATFNYLLPNATYRYINTVVTSGDNSTSAGAGAMIYVNQDGTFTRSAVGSFTNPGEYGQFTTDANGSYTGWFITEPTTNTRFSPGNQVFMRVRLNDGANGTTVQHYLTTIESVQVLAFSNGSTANDGTGIRAESAANNKNFVMVYDNEAGTGRPLFGTSIEVTEIDFSTLLYADFFKTSVAGTPGAWGGIVPNINTNGVRRVEERSLTTGLVVSANTSPDGMWGSVNTVNPAGGLTNILVLDLIPDSELSVNPSSLNGFSYTMNTGPSVSQAYTLSGSDLTGTGNITVTAPYHYEVSLDNTTWENTLELPFEGGEITGQPVEIHVRLKAGLNPGTYNNEAVTHSGGGADPVSVICSGNVIAINPELSEELLPEYIQGINGTNSQRVPYAFRMAVSNLIPGATYRYYNKVVLDTDPSSEDGVGVTIFPNVEGTFTRTENPSMTEGYGEFTAATDGTYTGWFVIESTGDARFTPGNSLHMRLMLNDGIDGTVVSCRLTSTTAAYVINFGTDIDPDMGTGIRAVSASQAGNFVFLYNNTTGTGRPVSGTSIETTGIDFTSDYAEFYTTHVEGTDGSWGSLIPNMLPSGIRRIEELSNENGTLVSDWTSENGVWGSTDTRNPDGGDADELVLDLLPPPVPTLIADPTVLSDFTYLQGFGPSASQTYALSGENLEGTGVIELSAPAEYEISLDDEIYSTALELDFENGVIVNQPVTIYVRLKTNLNAGIYNENIIHTGGGAETTVSLAGEVTLPEPPQITELTLPVYIQGINGTNNNRVPFAFRATLANLQPDATYRYYNKAVLASDAPDYTGVGNPIFVNSDGTFSRTTGTSLGTPGQYGELTTANDGSYTGWFMLEPTGNERFTPGNDVFMRIMLNDGNNGSSVAMHLTSELSSTVLMFETEQDSVQGTSIRGISEESAGNFIFLYDSIGSDLRPLYGTSIEITGIDYGATAVYAPFYVNTVVGTNGSWGGIVPNVNPDGVRMIKIFANNDGQEVNNFEMPTGIWGITDTRNPSGGVDEVMFIDLVTIDVQDLQNEQVKIYSFNQSLVVEPRSNERYEAGIFNLQGQQLMSFSGSGYRVINTNIPQGVYLIRYSSSSGVTSSKIFLK